MAPGYLADIVVVNGDPLPDINVVHKARWGMKAGKIVVDTTSCEIASSCH